MIPVEYVTHDESSISSYSADLNKHGVFISCDDPPESGSIIGVRLMIRINRKSSKIFQTEGTVI
jgi:hypothetical protein